MPKVKDFIVSTLCGLLRVFFSFLPASPLPLKPSRILIIKPCCLGDVLMASATVAQIRTHFPKALIAFAVSSWAKEALAHNPRIDQLLDCPLVGGASFQWWEYLRLIRCIRSGGFDLCFVLDRSPLLTVIPFLGGIPHRVGIDSQGRGFSLTVRVPWEGLEHEAELYLDTVRALGLKVEGAGLEFFPGEADQSWAQSILAAWRLGSNLPLLAIAPGGGINPGMSLQAKRWPPQRFATIATRIQKKGGRAVLVGSDGDRQAAEEIKAAVGAFHPDHLVDLVGGTTLGQLGALLQQCRLLISNDSAPMHLAVAVGTPVVAIFGPSHPDMYGPYDPKSVAVYHPVDCSPCFVRGRFNAHCREVACMGTVSVEEVWSAVEPFL